MDGPVVRPYINQLALERKLKRALVQPRVANYLPANARAEYGFEHVLLEPRDDRIMLQQI